MSASWCVRLWKKIGMERQRERDTGQVMRERERERAGAEERHMHDNDNDIHSMFEMEENTMHDDMRKCSKHAHRCQTDKKEEIKHTSFNIL
jgi:hypothetical protein